VVVQAAGTNGTPYFDRTARTWVLSRYADVLAALREPRLCLTGHSEPQPERSLFKELAEACMPHMKLLAERMLRDIPPDRPVDLVGEFAEPWCLELALLVCGADSGQKHRLFDLARAISAAAAEPRDQEIGERARDAQAQMGRFLQPAVVPIPVPTFVALSQTLPCLLANSWLALFEHPAEMARLRSGQTPLPNAIEELLRYAKIPLKVSRRATADVELGGAKLVEGDVVRLMVAQANRDGAHFPDPDRLDFSRCAGGQLSLGAGAHSCAGGPLIRIAAATATSAFLQYFGTARVAGPIEWRGGSGFRSPARLLISHQ
jgi:cytochrome P450